MSYQSSICQFFNPTTMEVFTSNIFFGVFVIRDASTKKKGGGTCDVEIEINDRALRRQYMGINTDRLIER